VGGIGFSELLLLALVTLLVVGPRRLPEMARLAGQWSRRARSAWESLRSEFQVELDRDHNQRVLDAERRAAEAEGQTDADAPVSSHDRTTPD